VSGISFWLCQISTPTADPCGFSCFARCRRHAQPSTPSGIKASLSVSAVGVYDADTLAALSISLTLWSVPLKKRKAAFGGYYFTTHVVVC